MNLMEENNVVPTKTLLLTMWEKQATIEEITETIHDNVINIDERK